MPIGDHQRFRLARPFWDSGQHNRQEVALRNHTAKPLARFKNVSSFRSVPSDPKPASNPLASHRSLSSAILMGSFAGFAGLMGLTVSAPSAPAAEPSGLPQAYSAKIVDTASLSPATTTASVAPVVSMLPVPSTKPDPAAAIVPLAIKKKVKKTVATTTTEIPIAEEALALPASKLKLSKTQDTKTPDTNAPVEAAKESSSNSSLDAAFAALRKCESGGNYKTATGNGYYGAYQFDPRTWRALGYSGLPSDAAPEVQDEAARKLLAKAGWGQWPACSRKLGLR